MTPKIPKGWRLLSRGRIYLGDKFYADGKWRKATGSIGHPVTDWPFWLYIRKVARPAKSPSARRKS